MLNKNLFLTFFFILIISFSFVSGQPPSDTQTNINIDTGLQVEFTQVDVYKNGEDHVFNAHVFNISDGLRVTNATTDCIFHLFDNEGVHQIDQVEMEFHNDGLDWDYVVSADNFTRNGEYSYLITCNATNIGGFLSSGFEVTQTGFQLKEAEDDLFKFGVGVLLLFLFAALIGLYKIENYIAKFTLYWTSHLLIILITFSLWTFTDVYALGYGGVAGIFKILFFFFIIAAFPMIILSIAWIVYIHAFNEHFQKLIDKGEDPETAFAMSKKKRGGWFSGK